MERVLSIGAVLLGLAALMFGAQALATWAAPRLKWCAPCLTFWLTWVALLLTVWLFNQPCTLRTVIDALIFAFINFFYIKSKIQIYE
jgi:hypothetical protein